MNYYYSKSTGGFYNKEELAPSDAVAISEARWNELLTLQSKGQHIVPDEFGGPIAVESVEKSAAEIREENASIALKYLFDTDFYFTVDKYATLSEERKAELTQKRAEARAVVNAAE